MHHVVDLKKTSLCSFVIDPIAASTVLPVVAGVTVTVTATVIATDIANLYCCLRYC